MSVLRARTLSLPQALVQSTAQRPLELAHSDAQAVRVTTLMVQGRRDALAELFDLCYALVEREAARALGRRQDLTQDATQEAWLRVARAPVRCECSAALDAWLRRVAASSAVDLLRAELARRVREHRFASSRLEAREFLEDSAQLDFARAVLAELCASDRALLELRARTGATLAQLGAALGVGPAAVDSRLRRAADRARRATEELLP
jgi:RNA polymerase sigma factor (sigma-70 family)